MPFEQVQGVVVDDRFDDVGQVVADEASQGRLVEAGG